jgi:hypothetical protein
LPAQPRGGSEGAARAQRARPAPGGRPHQLAHAPPIERKEQKSGDERECAGDQNVSPVKPPSIGSVGLNFSDRPLHRRGAGSIEMVLCFRAEAVLMEQHIELEMAGNEIDRLAHAVRVA